MASPGVIVPPFAATARERRFVNDPHPAADAEEFDSRSAAFKSRTIGATLRDRFRERFRFGDLRADVHLHAANLDVRHVAAAFS